MATTKIKLKNNTITTLIIPENFTVAGYILEAIYVDDNVANAPCFGGHICNRALFDITINGVKILEANLNNQNEGFPPPPMIDGIGNNKLDRYSSSVITQEQADAIAAASEFDFFIEIKAHPTNTNPHENITWVRLKNTEGKIIYSTCIAAGIATELTEAILLDVSEKPSFQEQIILDFNTTDLEIGHEYKICYDMLDVQYLNTISQNEKSYTFTDPCCSNILTKLDDNCFSLIPTEKDVACRVVVRFKCLQSALVGINLIKDNALISRDITLITSGYCNLASPNNIFTVEFESLDFLGTRTDPSMNFGNTNEKPILVKGNNYIDSIISLIGKNLTLNRLYEYQYTFIPNNPDLSIKPIMGSFFAGSENQKISSTFTISDNQIIILYATLKDVETGIVKKTRPIFLYNDDNCIDMLQNFHYSEIVAEEEGCNLEPCILIE